jgi:hypothetical protein
VTLTKEQKNFLLLIDAAIYALVNSKEEDDRKLAMQIMIMSQRNVPHNRITGNMPPQEASKWD